MTIKPQISHIKNTRLYTLSTSAIMSRAAGNNVRGPSSALTEFLRVRDSALYFQYSLRGGRKLESLPEQSRVASRRGYRIYKDNLPQDPVNFRITVTGGLGVGLKPQGGGVELSVSYLVSLTELTPSLTSEYPLAMPQMTWTKSRVMRMKWHQRRSDDGQRHPKKR